MISEYKEGYNKRVVNKSLSSRFNTLFYTCVSHLFHSQKHIVKLDCIRHIERTNVEMDDFGPENSSADFINATFIRPDPVIYGSNEERIVALFFLFVCTVWSLLFNTLILVTISKSETLHTSHFYVIGAFCAADILSTLFSSGGYISQFIADTGFSAPPFTACRFVSCVVAASVFTMMYLTGLLACERYAYFCHVYKYQSWFSTRRVVLFVSLAYLLPLLMITVEEVQVGRVYHATLLSCHLEVSGFVTVYKLFVIVLPSIITTAICTYKVWRLKATAQVNPAPNNNAAAHAPSVTPVEQAIKTVRMILLLSGSTWGSILPSLIMRRVIMSMDYSLEDLDSRLHYHASITYRVSLIMTTTIPSAVNPPIHYFCRKNLRTATKKLLGFNNTSNE